MTKSISEILKAANEIEGVADRVAFLQKNNSNGLQTILTICYDDSVESLLPQGEPPYTAHKGTDSKGMLYSTQHLNKLKIFFKGNGYDQVKPIRREALFIAFLESLDKEDAALIVAIKDKTMPYRKISKSFVEKAFPDIARKNVLSDANV